MEGIDKDSAQTGDRWLKVDALSKMPEKSSVLQLEAGRLH